MPEGLLQDKIIFLTGGGDGIGYECAKAYINAGARVIVADTNEEALAVFAKQYGKEHLGIVCDVSNKNEVSLALQKTIEQYGRLDAIHNNAGLAHPAKALHETSEEEWDCLMNVNLKAVYFTTMFGLEALKQSRGTILNTSSLVAEIGQEIHAAYSATKGALNALTKSMALDYAKFGIRVNAVSPAGVWTPMLRQWRSEQADPAAMDVYLDHIHPLGYCPNGDVVADTCVFLLSEKARFITGCIMPVSGGAELGYRK